MKHVSINDDFTFWFVLIDIFLLPYFNIVVIPISFFLIILWAIKNRRIVKHSKDYNGLLVCTILMAVSTIWGALVNAGFGVNSDNIKRLFQYGISFEYLYFFRHYFSNHRPNLKRLLYIFIAFVVVLAALFQINPTLYSTICSVFNKGNAYISSSFLENISYGYTLRYGFIWTDQNNIAYALTGIIMFILIIFEHDFAETIILFGANVFVLFCCMSSGGWIGFAISWILYLLYRITKMKRPSLVISRKALVSFVLIALIIFWVVDSGVLSQFLGSDLVNAAIERFENNENSRTDIWLRILREENIFLHTLIGNGSTMIINGMHRAAHSGHLYWIYAYGMISYFIFMKKFFWFGIRKVWKYIPILSFFLCFTMNTMIGEQKLFLIYIMIVAYLREVNSDEHSSQLDYSSL